MVGYRVWSVMYACMPLSSVEFEWVLVPGLRRKAIVGVGEAVRVEKRVMRSKSCGCGVLREEGVKRRKRNRW